MRGPFANFDDFSRFDVHGIGREPGVTRRDPTPVIRSGGRYHVWYSRTTASRDGYSATVWYASSADGRTWTEHGEAVGRGRPGAFDEHAVFTPTILVADGRYWLFYTAVPEPFTNDGAGPGITWGIAMVNDPHRPYLAGFECDLRFTGSP